MPHDYRRESQRSDPRSDPRGDYGGGGRMRSMSDRDRYTMRDQDRFSPRTGSSFSDRDQDSDRSYYAERPFEDRGDRYPRASHRDMYERNAEQGARSDDRAPEYRTRDDWRPPNRGRFDERHGFRHSQAGDNPQRDWSEDRGTGLLRWEDDQEETPYFGTGTYYGAYSTGPSARASGSAYGDRGYLGASEKLWHDDPATWEEDTDRSRVSSGSYESYGRSPFGAQGGYDRPYGDASRPQGGYGQNYREQFAEQRYGRDPEFGYGFDAERSVGTFRGRGPKGYERSDERLREIICERLTDDPRIDASEVHIEVKDKIVKLTGTVSDRRTKYEIEDLVERCGGLEDIDNQVRVRAGSGMTQSSGGAIRSNQRSYDEGIASASSSDSDTKSAASRTTGAKRTQS